MIERQNVTMETELGNKACASQSSEGELTGKVALVTGAGRGIGRAIALTLARRGAVVVVNYNGSRDRALEVVAEIEAAGGSSEAVGCDVSDFGACVQPSDE